MPARQEFNKRTKVKRFQHAGGKCEECGKRLSTGDIEYHHLIPAAFGGGGDFDNCRVYCRACHRVSTSKIDIPAISKSNRVFAAHIGAKGRSSRPMPAGRVSKWKKKLDGRVVPRER